jgi:MazG family protein
MNSNADFGRLIKIMDELREKCPWDRKQTVDTLRHLTIEETYELADAISDKDWQGIKEELGDLLLHIIFYAKIGAEQEKFSLQQVIDGVCDKLVTRHPHIYGDEANDGKLVSVESDEDVKLNWEKIKLKEGKKTILGGVPKALPALVKAIRLQEKSKTVGFEWEHKEQVWDKVKEEIEELEEAVSIGDSDKMEDELGDVFFSLVNFARFLHIDAENALERTNKKFIKRFNGMEKFAQAQHKNLQDMSLEEMDALWNTMKDLKI